MRASNETLGIDIGSTNVKLVHLDGNGGARQDLVAHDGDVPGALQRLFERLEIDTSNGTRALVTGTEGRRRVAIADVIAAQAIEAGLRALQLSPRAVVSMGGEDLALYGLDVAGRIINTWSGNKCASGTGEFFRQQMGRMNLDLDQASRASEGACVHSLSSRCSVFMKSDCTHRLNKGEATKGDIALSLSRVMADKVSDFLTKARLTEGQVALLGGVTKNKFLVDFLREAWPKIDFVVPSYAAVFEAWGAACLAEAQGSLLPALDDLLRADAPLSHQTFPALDGASDQVRYAPSMRGEFKPEANYILGVDGGSTTTKVTLVDLDSLEIVAAHYGRTHGDPVAALKECLREVLGQLGGHKPKVVLAAATGSSRELLGVFLETPGVYNEIIAHTVGTTFFEPEVDTLFEIGGQDAKYVLINNGVPIDYAMNEACSAGTGSFLEESARGDLNIETAPEIGPIALQAIAPLKFGEHCSAFINSDIRKAIGEGARQSDIVAGLIFSIVANYLNRVVGNRKVGGAIALQGGVAKNPAVPLAFAQMTGKPIVVPPDPELMGCFGVARMVQRKHNEGLVALADFDLEALLEKEIVYKDSFTCQACENLCEIKNLRVSGRPYPFGGRCSKYTNARKKKKIRDKDFVDHTAERHKMIFEQFCPNPDTLVQRTAQVVGVPLAMSVHSLWPFYSWFFHHLGVRTRLSTAVSPEGIARLESNYCYPIEIAHGALQNVLDQGVDRVFLPHFRDMPSMEAGEVHACTCPLTQGLPYIARHAFGLADEMVLRPVVSFKHGWDSSKPAFVQVAQQLGFDEFDGERAFNAALMEFQVFTEAYRARGEALMAEIEANPDRVYVAMLGRPYNAFTRDANMGIPRKITSQGVTVVPFDMIYDPAAEIFPYMYWYYGQQNMKAVRKVRQTPNLFLTWISNFSCAPDSFMLHYIRWMMGDKPYLILEIDSHTADAGIDTRVEAFLDIVDSYRRHVTPTALGDERRRYVVEPKEEFCDVVDRVTGKRIDIRDPRVRLVWPSMGEYSAKVMARAARGQGIRSEHLPVADVNSTALARQVASGKECIPTLLVLGAILKYLKANPPNQPDEYMLFVVPSTLGPCRTGQYHVFYDRIFEEMGWENIMMMVSSSEDSYRELGPTFSKDVWRGLSLADYFIDARIGARLLASDPQSAVAEVDQVWEEVCDGLVQGPKALDKALAKAGRSLKAIARKRALRDIPRVLIVGEIYVRRDDFSIGEVRDFLIDRGIYPKVTGITEWFYYTDYARKLLMEERRQRDGLRQTLMAGGLREELVFHVESAWKHNVERKIRKHLMPTGLVADAPHGMKDMIEGGRSKFFDPALESEATVSSAVAAAAMAQGYSGVVIIMPFACLPGRLIEGVFAPWAREQGYPVIALENDGQPYPPNVVSRLDVFSHNVARYEAVPSRNPSGLAVS